MQAPGIMLLTGGDDRIFESRNDYLMFINLLKDTTELWDIRISAYYLMPNHLLTHTPKGNLSRCMRQINAVYTQRFNRIHGFDGQVFRGRFKSIVVARDSYLLQLVRYLHRNPLRAGVTDHLDEYPWTSHNGYVSSAKKTARPAASWGDGKTTSEKPGTAEAI